LGQKLKAHLNALRGRVAAISDIRGPGSMVAVEFAKPDGTPDADFTRKVQERARDAGLLVLTCGVYSNVIRFLYPLTIEDAVFEEGMAILAKAIES
jgi:4-aminobutyrate aminotransferase